MSNLRSFGKAVLEVHRVSFQVHLGWTTEERRTPQRVEMDLQIQFPRPPRACDSDELDDTMCYESLVKIIQSICSEKEFRLIEHLCHDTFSALCSRLAASGLETPEEALWVRVSKPHLPLPVPSQGASFSLGNRAL